jgi:hypothetical protein
MPVTQIEMVVCEFAVWSAEAIGFQHCASAIPLLWAQRDVDDVKGGSSDDWGE